MAKKRATKRKATNDVAVKNEEVEENNEEQEASVEENGVASTSKSKAGGKKKSVAKSEPKAETSKSKAKSSKAQSDTEEEDEEDYEVEKIIDVNTKKNGKREFLIRWKNYSAKHDTWEPEDNLSCDELIAKFLEAQEAREKQPRKELRENPKSVARYAAQSGRKSKRTAATRKSYTEAEDEDDA